MSVTASCGHVLTEEEGLGTKMALKGTCKDGSKCIDLRTVCDKCANEYRKDGRELLNDAEVEHWYKTR